jgi:dipeptidyl-peptidase-3
MVYAKRVFFSNGIHHHYSMLKFKPDFSQEYFEKLMKESGVSLDRDQLRVIFDPNLDPKKVNLDPEKGLIIGSAVNFYAHDLMDDEVEAFYAYQKETAANPLWSYGINSKMRRAADGSIYEDVYKFGGLYGSALERMIHYLDLAASVAESDCQAEALRTLIQYYQTGEQCTMDSMYRRRH